MSNAKKEQPVYVTLNQLATVVRDDVKAGDDLLKWFVDDHKRESEATRALLQSTIINEWLRARSELDIVVNRLEALAELLEMEAEEAAVGDA